jgi:hypothetical protein
MIWMRTMTQIGEHSVKQDWNGNIFAVKGDEYMMCDSFDQAAKYFNGPVKELQKGILEVPYMDGVEAWYRWYKNSGYIPAVEHGTDDPSNKEYHKDTGIGTYKKGEDESINENA